MINMIFEAQRIVFSLLMHLYVVIGIALPPFDDSPQGYSTSPILTSIIPQPPFIHTDLLNGSAFAHGLGALGGLL